MLSSVGKGSAIFGFHSICPQVFDSPVSVSGLEDLAHVRTGVLGSRGSSGFMPQAPRAGAESRLHRGVALVLPLESVVTITPSKEVYCLGRGGLYKSAVSNSGRKINTIQSQYVVARFQKTH